MLEPLLTWLDAVPARYWTCAWLALAAVVASAVAAWWRPGERAARWNAPWVFVLLIGVALFAFRWPVLMDNQPDLNPDESQIIAGALTLRVDPVFWRSVDGHTAGPFATYPLVIASCLGVTLDYTAARVVAVLLMWTALVCTWLTLRVRFGDGVARLLTLPAVVFEAGALFLEFSQYTSEQVPVALIALATWLVVRALFPSADAPSRRRLALAGLVLGAVPFAKLQAVPMGLWLGLFAVFTLLRDRDRAVRIRLQLLAALLGGVAVVPGVLLAMILSQGIWADFWSSYILDNFHYAGTRMFGWLETPWWFYQLGLVAENFHAFFLPVLGLLLVGAFAGRAALRDLAARRYATLLVGLLLAAFYATMAPGRPFQHYLQLLVMPLTLAAAACYGPLLDFNPPRAHAPSPTVGRPWRLAWGALFLAAAMGFQIHGRATAAVLPLGSYGAAKGQLHRSAAGALVHGMRQPGDTLAAWGWSPRIFVETGLPQATREAHTSRQIVPSDRRDYYRERYWRDFQRSRPRIFVDAVGEKNFYFSDRARDGHESFPALAERIAAGYRLVHDVEGTRIYVRAGAGGAR